MGRLAHSIAFLCLVSATRCMRVKAYRNKIHIADLDRTEQKDASNLSFIPHPPWIGTVVGVYNLARSITDIVKHIEDFNAVANSKMVGDMMYDLESLYTIHDLIAKKLSLKSEHYDCDNCTDAQVDANYAFQRQTFSGVNWETINNDDCVHEMKNLITVLRGTLTKLELGSYKMVRNLEQKSLTDGAHDDEELASLFEVDMGCDGAEFDASRLETFHEPSLLLEAEGLEAGHCRELPSLSPSDAQAACMQKCLAEADCAGFTWLDGRDDETINGNRCCFRSDISHRYAQEETSCFVASRARLLHLDTKGVSKWLTDHGFKAASHGLSADSADNGLQFNGLVLAALTKSKIQQYLGPMDNAQAAQIKCAVDVDIVGVGQHQCEGQDVVARYQAGVGVVDPYVFFGVKSGNGAFLTKNWAIGAASRLLSYSQKFFFGLKGKTSHYLEAIQSVQGLLNTYLGWAYAYNAGNDFVDMTFLSTAFNPLVYANAVTLLTKTGMEARWDSCSFVYGQLMEQNVWEQVDVYAADLP